mgnify:CR=1 FL=1
MLWRIIVLSLLLGVPVFAAGCGEMPIPTQRRPLLDTDGDSYPSTAHGGRDCNDEDPNINPLAKEKLGDGIDQNCNAQKDEFTLDDGYWKMTITTKQPNWEFRPWSMQIKLDKKVGTQYVKCILFGFKYKSQKRKNTMLSPTQWLTGLSVKHYPVGTKKINTFEWRHTWTHNDGSKVNVVASGTFTGPKTVKGKMTIRYEDKLEKAQGIVDYTGKYTEPKAKDDSDKRYCEVCLGSSTCQ